MVWYSHIFKNFPQFVVTHTVKGFSIVNETEVDIFLDSLAFCMIQQILVIWSLVPLPFLNPAWSKSSLNIWKFLGHILLKPNLKDFEHYLAILWNEWNCVVVSTFFGIALLWDLNETDFPSPVASANFSKFSRILSAVL